MSNPKKNQPEAEHLSHWARECIKNYEEVYSKFLKAGSQAQKERIGVDLRKEYWKLRRLRENIKPLLPTMDAKDARLESYLRVVDEKVVALEKEGLPSDPAYEAQRARTEEWIKLAIESARKQVDLGDLDPDRGNRGHHGRGKSGTGMPTTAARQQRLKFHIHNLEQLLKSLSCGELNPDDVDEIEDCVKKVIHNEGGNNDDDELERDVCIYRSFGFGEEDDGSGHLHDLGKKSRSEASLGAKSAGKTGKADQGRRQSPLSQSPKRGNGGGSVGTKGSASDRDEGREMWDESADIIGDEMDRLNADTFGDEAMEILAPGSLAEMSKATGSIPRLGDWEKGRPPSLVSQSLTSNKKQMPEQSPTHGASLSVGKGGASSAGSLTASAPAATSAPQPQRAHEQKQPSGSSSSAQSPAPTISAAPTILDKQLLLHLVDMSLANLPHTQDVDKQRPFEPSNPTTCPSYYPQKVLPALASPEIYRAFELETLFFIFYYHRNTYQQYCAAGQIKERSFRYHTQLNTWFKRNGQPKESSEEGESGSFQYFNFEETWRLEEKEDFHFNYDYLENELR
ncbi:Not1 N terminal domain [Trypanosoma vivax]|uniref:NOT5 protein (NOT5) n=1 Tax=Trypanosoma vivax (strain Y486) TaxID=1055687 RepID=G0TSK7_TRYVY|nr:hypothetical protein TRVL_06135 [Trypanosoma vivax]KAH8605765.1 Not1 N terminal domain [Trypanosoma vivax]CCC46934.1 conserved hypothetical protein [Trypanosoma vivax Y486]